MDDYTKNLNQRLASLRKRVRQGNEITALRASAPTLFEIIDGEISLELNRAFGDKPLGYEDYLESHGAVRGIKRIRSLLEAKEAEVESSVNAAQAVEDDLKQIKKGV